MVFNGGVLGEIGDWERGEDGGKEGGEEKIEGEDIRDGEGGKKGDGEDEKDD